MAKRSAAGSRGLARVNRNTSQSARRRAGRAVGGMVLTRRNPGGFHDPNTPRPAGSSGRARRTYYYNASAGKAGIRRFTTTRRDLMRRMADAGGSMGH